MSYNSKYKGAEVEGLLDSIGNKVDKVDGKQLSTEDFTTPLKQKLDGLSNYQDEIDIILKQINVETEIKTDTELQNGVYILTEDRQLVSNSTVDPTAIGVVLVTSNQRILIYKHNLHYGDESHFYWGKNLYGKNVAGINDVAFNTEHQDFNGKLNTHAIISAYVEHGVDMDEQDMCTALCAFNSNFNENGGYVDWYIPAAGQLIEIDKNFNAINTALNNINGTKFNTFSTLWSSTEQSENFGFIVDVKGNKTTHSGNKYKNYVNKVRLIRDYAPTKTISIKNKLVELEQSIPTKTSQLENDAPYALKSDVEIDVENGVYAMDKNGELIDYNVADSSCLGVVLVQGVHKFMIAKTDATDGTNNTFSWLNYYNNLLLTDYLRAEGENTDGFLNSADETPNLSNDYTTWVSGALSDFNGKTNTIAIQNISDETSEMGTVLKAFNVSDNFKDWYIPACGQLALIYLNIAEINIALEKIGGTTLIANDYWSSSECQDSAAWCINFDNSYVSSTSKDYLNRIRFIRDITTTKPLKEIIVELESTKQDMIEDLDDIRDGASKGATALQEK